MTARSESNTVTIIIPPYDFCNVLSLSETGVNNKLNILCVCASAAHNYDK